MTGSDKVKPFSVFFNKKKIAELQQCIYEIMSNDGHEVVDGGTFFTDGVTQSKVTCTTIVPVRGISVSILVAALNHQDVMLSMGVVDGKLHEVVARNTTITYESQFTDGKFTGKFEFMCKKPTVTG